MPTVIETNCLTGETIEREMDDAEYAQYLVDQAADNAEVE